MQPIPELTILFHRFAIALGLGLLIGVERESEKSGTFAGIRTFPLISLMGCTAALINGVFAPWVFAVALIILAAVVITAYIHTASPRSHGITTEIASFLSFLIGGLVWWEMSPLAAALAVVTVLLLTSKEPLEALSHKIAHQDIATALQFGIITLIVLPILPDKAYGPLAVLNPHTVWLMVVLIAGINFVGYVLIKTVGPQKGIGITGLLGGFASSTALTLGFSRHSRSDSQLSPEFALGIVFACAIMFIKVLVETFTVNPSVGQLLLIPIGSAGCAGLLCCVFLWFIRRRQPLAIPDMEHVKASNPFALWPAILFGLLFACILFISKAAQVYLGTGGLYLSSILAGLADVDPITLSLSNLAGDTISTTVAARGITFAALSNTAVKMLIACTGAPGLMKHSLPIFVLMIGTGLVVSFTLI